MANLQNLLGTMLATGMGGRSARGPAFATGMRPGIGRSGGGFGQAAGLASLGYLAYKAYQQYQTNNPAAQQGTQVHGNARSATGGGRSLGDRMADMLSRGPHQEDPAMEAGIGDQKAILLIRAMVAAANADGEIDESERRHILSQVDAAGGDAEDRRILERELADPPSIDDIVAGAGGDPETAEQVYLAARTAIKPDGKAEQSWLAYLADRLNLSGERLDQLKQSA